MAHLKLVSDSTTIDPEAERSAMTILLTATGAVVGEVSKVYQTLSRTLEQDLEGKAKAAAGRAFNSLPGWQRDRIATVALEAAGTARTYHAARERAVTALAALG